MIGVAGLLALCMEFGICFVCRLSRCLRTNLKMLFFDKLAIVPFRVECMFVEVQKLFAVTCLLACSKTLHFELINDELRWLLVAHFSTDMLLTSILGLKHVPMSIVVVFGVLSALLAFGIERFYPDALKVVGWTLLSILAIWAAAPFTLGTCRVMILSPVSFGSS